jgi:hypothetical protein
MGGGRRASVQASGAIASARTHQTTATLFLSRISIQFSCDLVGGFSYVYPETGLSRTIPYISQSAAARHPLNWMEAQPYALSRTFLVRATSLLMDQDDPSKPCTQ